MPSNVPGPVRKRDCAVISERALIAQRLNDEIHHHAANTGGTPLMHPRSNTTQVVEAFRMTQGCYGEGERVHQLPSLRFHVGFEEAPQVRRNGEKSIIKQLGGFFARKVDGSKGRTD